MHIDRTTRDEVCERLDGVDELLRMSLDDCGLALEGGVVSVMRSAIRVCVSQLEELGE